MNRILFLSLLAILYFAMDFYLFTMIKSVLKNASVTLRRMVFIGYWLIGVVAVTGVFFYAKIVPLELKQLRVFVTTFFFVTFMGKLVASLLLLLDDLRRGITWMVNLFPFSDIDYSASRSGFMSKSALIAGAVPIATLGFGVVSGAYDYRVRRKTVYLSNLPKAFDGLRIVQISDIHTGSFFNKTAVMGGVDMVNEEKPDMMFFTGDLVNGWSREAKEYLDVFKKIKPDMGTYSVMGNHDYGDYREWSSVEEKNRDVKALQDMHRYMGWDILLNENRIVNVDNEQLVVLGCENWGIGRFPKYGDMKKTVKGVEDFPFKLLLSHDPSHWDAQIRPHYGDIDLVLAGHTHGCQFGIEIGEFRWSPIQYKYKQWADLYREGDQYLYVNRGFGFIGYPGRVGILPEITVLELKTS